MFNYNNKILIIVFALITVAFVKAQSTQIREKLLKMDLPLIEIETINGEEPTYVKASPPPGCWGEGIKDATKVPGRMRIYYRGLNIYDSGEYIKDKSGMTIKIRGNTSAYMKMKPYKIKLQKEADLLFRGDFLKYKDKNYLLIVDENYSKKIGFRVNEMVGLQWTPDYEYANVILNGDYKGMYMLVESVSRNKNCRLNVTNTGYIFEYDPYWWNEDVCVKSPTLIWPMHYTFKYPDTDDITAEQLSYFENLITKIENSLDDGTYPDYLDLESFASWMIGHDILGNNDGAGSNIYLTKKDNTDTTKVMMGNMWDFDWIFYRENKWDAAHDIFYFDKLFNSTNDEFKNAYVNKWNTLSPLLLDEMASFLYDFANSSNVDDINESIALTNQRWNKEYETVQHYVEKANNWFSKRKEWLDAAIKEMDTISSMKSIQIDETLDSESNTSYYNLLGLRINKPNKGIYLKKGKKIIVSN